MHLIINIVFQILTLILFLKSLRILLSLSDPDPSPNTKTETFTGLAGPTIELSVV